MDSRCSFCFHPLAAAGAACQVCATARTTTTPFGSSSPNQVLGSPFVFSPPPPEFGSASFFGRQAAPPATAVTSSPLCCSTPSLSAVSLFSTPQETFVLERFVFDDDDPVENPPPATVGGVQGQGASSSTNGLLVLRTHCELPAVARGCARDGFAVLVHAKAPAAATDHTRVAPRASLDLVTVLDVSSSMEGGKLELLKEAMGFLIDKLGPADRLSVVSFSHQARRVTPLMRMSDAGKTSAKLSVESLSANGRTDILLGLDTAAKVLNDRRYKNAVASIILLSDGHDNCNHQHNNNYGMNRSYDYLVPRSLAGCKDGNRSTPIHTFGFGTDHDTMGMHAIAEMTGGTYSFMENKAVVQDAFAQCLGGLLSVAVQDAWITVACPHPDVRVRSINSGRYESRVLAYGRAAYVDVGELYADEERRFMLFVDVPIVRDDDDVIRLIIKGELHVQRLGDGEVNGGGWRGRRPAEADGGDKL